MKVKTVSVDNPFQKLGWERMVEKHPVRRPGFWVSQGQAMLRSQTNIKPQWLNTHKFCILFLFFHLLCEVLCGSACSLAVPRGSVLFQHYGYAVLAWELCGDRGRGREGGGDIRGHFLCFILLVTLVTFVLSPLDRSGHMAGLATGELGNWGIYMDMWWASTICIGSQLSELYFFLGK